MKKLKIFLAFLLAVMIGASAFGASTKKRYTFFSSEKTRSDADAGY